MTKLGVEPHKPLLLKLHSRRSVIFKWLNIHSLYEDAAIVYLIVAILEVGEGFFVIDPLLWEQPFALSLTLERSRLASLLHLSCKIHLVEISYLSVGISHNSQVLSLWMD